MAKRVNRASFGGAGDSYNNFLAEMLMGLCEIDFNRRLGAGCPVEAIELAALDWDDLFNNRRLLEPAGEVLPVHFEQAYYRRIESQAVVARLTHGAFRETRGDSHERKLGAARGSAASKTAVQS